MRIAGSSGGKVFFAQGDKKNENGCMAWERSAEDEKIYQQVMPALMAGQSAKELGEMYGVSPEKLRVWKLRACKNRANVFKPDPIPGVSLSKPLESLRYNEDVMSLRGRVTHRSLAMMELGSRDPDQFLRPLKVAQNNIEQLLDAINRDLERGKTVRSCASGGVVQAAEVPIGVTDFKDMSTAMKNLVNDLGRLWQLPLETVKLGSVDLKQADAPSSMHLHLHSHGKRGRPPKLAGSARVIEAQATEITQDNQGPTAPSDPTIAGLLERIE